MGAGGGGSGWGAEGLALLASAPPARDKGLRRRRRPRMTAHGRDIDDGQGNEDVNRRKLTGGVIV